MVLMSPSGDVAIQQRNLIIASTGLMLLIIVPVLCATALFAWRYRASNTGATYTPEWNHSTQLEVLIWTAPLLIIIALGALTWISTHILDPFRPISRISADEPVLAGQKHLTIEVVALDWKWVFFYPDQGIATVNELAAPVDTPIDFKITSATVMNTFFVPALAGQIYAMAGMQTKLGAVINSEGVFEGFSGNYSGAGFSHMNFKFHSLSHAGFQDWVAKVKAQGQALDLATYQALEKPSESVPVTYYSSVKPGLYDSILNLCVDPGKMCIGQMMAIDAMGGSKEGGSDVRDRLKYDGAAPAASGDTDAQPKGMDPSMPGMDMTPKPAPAPTTNQ
jgi:cytochrome o ubiquinol oxidase subunit 2